MSSSQTILHIVYVHGFQGDHTTFQSFPTDLHKTLLPQIPSHINLRSTLYPTYKSKRPIAEATQNLLHWLDTIPHGPVILCGHSMGGLLVAEAATSRTHSAARRVIAVLAFDVPFLGMHPHVVISGIASLLPNKTGDSSAHGSEQASGVGGGLRSEREMNDGRHVHVPTDEGSSVHSANASKTSFSDPDGSTSNMAAKPPPLPPRPSSHTLTPLSPTPSSPATDSITNPARRSPSPSPGTPAFIQRTLALVDAHANDPLVRFITKNRDDPLGAAKRWVVERFEFGVCMFEPKGLRDRYAALQAWQRPWVAFWTETAPGAARDAGDGAGKEEGAVEALVGAEVKGDERAEGLRAEEDATESLGRLLAPTLDGDVHDPVHVPSASPPLPPSLPTSPPPQTSPPASPPLDGPLTQAAEKAARKSAQEAAKRHEKALKAAQKQHEKDVKSAQKQHEKELKALRKQQQHGKSPHHFVVRPFSAPSSPTHRWEEVKVRGAKDEVEAHCGLFLRDVNWEYDRFVGRVADVVREWVGDYDGDIN